MAIKITDKFPHLQDKAALEASLLKHTVDSARAEGIDARVVDGKIVVFPSADTDQSSGKKRSEKSSIINV